jgi:hypothetical protein
MFAALIPLLFVVAPVVHRTVATAAEPPVRVWLEPDHFVTGDRAKVLIHMKDDGYVVVFHVDTDGRISVIFPVDPGDDDFLRGQYDIEMRSRGDREAFQAGEPGLGTIYAAVSRTPYHFDNFVRGDHWNAPAFGDRISGDAETRLNDIMSQISPDRFDYDIATYSVERSVARSYTPADAGSDYGNGGYGYGGYGYGGGYGWGPYFSFGISFGSPYYGGFYPYYYRPWYYAPWAPYYGYGYGYGYYPYYPYAPYPVAYHPYYPTSPGYPYYPYGFKPGGLGGGTIPYRHPVDMFAQRPVSGLTPIGYRHPGSGTDMFIRRPITGLTPINSRRPSGSTGMFSRPIGMNGATQPMYGARAQPTVFRSPLPPVLSGSSANRGTGVIDARGGNYGGYAYRGHDDGLREAPHSPDSPRRAVPQQYPGNSRVTQGETRPSMDHPQVSRPSTGPQGYEPAHSSPAPRAPDRPSSGGSQHGGRPMGGPPSGGGRPSGGPSGGGHMGGGHFGGGGGGGHPMGGGGRRP